QRTLEKSKLLLSFCSPSDCAFERRFDKMCTRLEPGGVLDAVLGTGAKIECGFKKKNPLTKPKRVHPEHPKEALKLLWDSSTGPTT
uniref:Uncharacterized protein n=1 Tax=Oryzias latipes TaxID=8090 RepID=A0A3B3INC3_ORYLA